MNHLRLLLLWCVLALLAGAGPLAAADDLEPVRRLQSSGQWPEALRRIDTLLVAKPDDPQLRFFKGVLLSDSQRNAEALAVFERLTQDYPELPEPYNNIAALHAAAGDFDRAEAALEQALRANPSFAAAHENLGDVHLMLARRAYARALKLEPGSPSLANKLALVQQLGKLAAPSPAVSAASAPR